MMEFYDTNASLFIESWLTADMKEEYGTFENLIKEGAKILDGGCGSGRDSLYFLQKGYDVTAFDPSDEMIKYASQFTGIKIGKARWEELDDDGKYDAVWASASLYHVSRKDMSDVFDRIARALKKNGILFASYRDRPDDFSENGRSFTSFDRKTFEKFVKDNGKYDILEIKERKDSRKGKEDEMWLFAYLRKKD